MNKSSKVILLCIASALVSLSLVGCGNSSANTGAGSEFEQKINAPKGPPPPEAAKATADALAKEKAAAPVTH